MFSISTNNNKSQSKLWNIAIKVTNIIVSLIQMAKNKLIRTPADTEVVSSFARQYQVIKAKKKQQQQPTSRQSSTEESDKTKVNTYIFSA